MDNYEGFCDVCDLPEVTDDVDMPLGLILFLWAIAIVALTLAAAH